MKNKTTAGILALTLGVFGVHRFYLGQTLLGILYLFLPPIGAILGFIDGILLLTMHQDVFDAKYNREDKWERKRAKRDRRREKRTQRRDERQNRRKSRSQVKPRHRVKNSPTVTTNRDRTDRAKRKVTFKKIHEQGLKYFKDYQFDEAEKSYLKALNIAPDHPKLLYDLACLYAMKEDADKGFEYLALAVHKGFKDLDDIETNPALAYLRIQDEFLDFAKAGYRTLVKKEEHGVELLEQLRQLDILRSRGMLTEFEFEEERKKLMH